MTYHARTVLLTLSYLLRMSNMGEREGGGFREKERKKEEREKRKEMSFGFQMTDTNEHEHEHTSASKSRSSIYNLTTLPTYRPTYPPLSPSQPTIQSSPLPHLHHGYHHHQ